MKAFSRMMLNRHDPSIDAVAECIERYASAADVEKRKYLVAITDIATEQISFFPQIGMEFWPKEYAEAQVNSIEDCLNAITSIIEKWRETDEEDVLRQDLEFEMINIAIRLRQLI